MMKSNTTAFGNPTVYFINPAKKLQSFISIGAAITDASAETFVTIPKAHQDKFLKDYYHPAKGIRYTFVRTPINSCDFSNESFTYVKDDNKDFKDLQYRDTRYLLVATPSSP